MTEQIIAKFEQYIQAATPHAKHIWEVLVYQQTVEGIGNVLAFLFVGIVGVLIAKKVIACLDAEQDACSYHNSDIEEARIFVLCVTSVFGLLYTIAATFNMTSIFTHITNPEYHAIMDLMKSVQ